MTYYNRLYEAKDVMKTALHDLYRTKKDVSIHGLPRALAGAAREAAAA